MNPPGTRVDEVLALLRRLSAAPAVTTNWQVVTGAPSAGKTTLLRDLSALGYSCSGEAARDFFEEEARARGSIEAAWRDPGATVEPIHRRRRSIERSINPIDVHFLDTAVPDTLAYALLFGAECQAIVEAAAQRRYRNVFILDPLPFEAEPVRAPLADDREAIDALIEAIYRALDYHPVRIAALPREARVRAVLSHMEPEHLS